MPATTPRPRSPAPTEAARRNALKQGLAALHDFVLEDEAPSELEELTARLIGEYASESEIEARLVKRMAIAFWKSERAERIEVALFDAAPKIRPPQAGFEWEQADPLTNHLRPQALQRRPRLPGPAGPGAVALPEGAAPAAPRAARRMHGRTRARAAE